MRSCWSQVKIGTKEMTTSPDQRGKMRKLPAHSRVRRRLFEIEAKDEAAMDNFANVLQESCRIVRSNMMKKWSFDPKREVPVEGNYEWYQKNEDTWIGMKVDQKISKSDTLFEDKFIPIEKENQMTPKVLTVEAPPEIRKRKREDSILSEKGAKRKISFD